MAATYEPIETKTLGSGQTSVTFTSVPTTYTDLVLIVNGTGSSGVSALKLQVGNGSVDTGSNYSWTNIQGDGISAGSSRGSGVTEMNLGLMDTTISTSIFHFMNYSNTTTYKTFLGSGADTAYAIRKVVGLWRNTAAINTFTLSGTTLQTGTTLSLYGIKAA
jgi:hypothetical protein